MTTATSNAFEFESKLLTLDQLVDCPLNRRPIDPDSADLHELGASLAQRQEVDLIVRPSSSQAGKFEVLDGKRRLAGARLAGVPVLWCQVRDPCTDAEALKVILVTQFRANLDPLTEAGLVRSLIDGGLTREACAAELGRPVGWVARRAALTDLSLVWSDAQTRPEWASIGFLEIIARLPQAVQVEIATDYAEAWRRPASVAEFDLEIRERYLHQLKHAPWKLDDLAVLPKAGACTACPKRSNCQTSLFDDQPDPADRCLDAVCWAEKLDAHNGAKARTLAAKHPKVLILTGRAAGDHAQPAPSKLPEQAVVVQRTHGLEDCRKTDDGAFPALDVETGKQSWVRVEKWADTKLRVALGLDDEPTGKGTTKVREHERGAPTAEQRREAKRQTWRLLRMGEAIVDADPPDLMQVVRLYAVFCEGAMSTLDAAGWRDVQKMPEDELRDLLWQAVTRRASLECQIRATALSDDAIIANLERLATLDPVEQRTKAMAEIPEPKRKG